MRRKDVMVRGVHYSFRHALRGGDSAQRTNCLPSGQQFVIFARKFSIASESRSDLRGLLRRQFAVDILIEHRSDCFTVRIHQSFRIISFSMSRSISRARLMRLLTVPMGMSSTFAISL